MIISAVKTIEDVKQLNIDPYAQVDIVQARQAVPHMVYYCCECGAKMTVKHNQNGTYFFACKHDSPHRKNSCSTRAASISKKQRTVDDPKFDPEEFLENLIPTEAAVVVDRTPGEGGPVPPTEREPNPNIDVDDVVTAPARSIKDLIDEKLHRMSPEASIKTGSEIKVKDLIFGLPSIRSLISDPSLLDGKNKIVEMRPLFGDKMEEALWCKVFINNQTSKREGVTEEIDKDIDYEKIYLKINVSDPRKSYYDWYNKLFQMKEVHGKNKPARIFETIFVAANWRISNTTRQLNKDNRPFPVLETTIYDFSKQVYCLPNPPKKEHN